jgi:hypothetical protein
LRTWLGLEIEPQRKLANARVKRSNRLAEVDAGHIARWQSKIWMVENVKEVCLELNRRPFVDLERLRDTKIPVEVLGAEERIAV